MYSKQKFDVLGLKTLDVIANSLKMIDPSYSYYDIYKVVKDNDEDTFSLIRKKESDGLFQLESDLFKHTIGEMQPNNLNDIAALNAICRPGPLSAGLDKQYNDTKNGKQDLIEPLRNTLDIVKDTYGAIIYQEQLMAISVKSFGFNVNQSDSITRKITAKKDKKKLPMLRRMMIWGKKNIEGPEGWKENENSCWYDPNADYGDEICGGLSNGYTQNEIEEFFKMILGFADYCFNKSHAMCYGYIGYITAYLKTHYPTQFMASLLSMQTESAKIDNYISVSRSLGIEVKVPDINKSKADFTIGDNCIYYGFGAIKGVGAAAIPNIIENQPYSSFEDFYNKTNHTIVKKNIITNLILTGCFKELCSNPHVVLKEFVDIKKLKEDDSLYVILKEAYNKNKCIEYEKDLLGSSITYVSVWDSTADLSDVEIEGVINKYSEKTDKNGKLMGFLDIESEGSSIRAIIFASKYKTLRSVIDFSNNTTEFVFQGNKKDKSTIIIENIDRITRSEEKEWEFEN